MDADRYGSPRGLNPGAMAAALGGTALFLFGLSLTAPNFVPIPEGILVGTNIPLPTPPKPKDPPPKPQPKQKDQPTIPAARPDPVQVTKTIVEAAPGANGAKAVDVDPNPGTGVGFGNGAVTLPIHVPLEFGAKLDQRYAGSFQPDYPVGERAAEHEGRVVVRVLIGVDGRVKQVEQVSAASRAFFEATRKRALEKWRFTPATRDGVPYETWYQIGVMFQLETE